MQSPELSFVAALVAFAQLRERSEAIISVSIDSSTESSSDWQNKDN
jgi:hypothetical protein